MKKDNRIFYKCLNCGHVYSTIHEDIFNNITICKECGKKFVITFNKKLNRPWWKIDWEEISKDEKMNKTYQRSIILFFICILIYLLFFT